MGQTWVTSCGTQVPWMWQKDLPPVLSRFLWTQVAWMWQYHLPAFFFVPKIILAQSIKAYFGGSLRKQPSLCEASWAAVFAVWSWAPWLGVMWREWWRKSFFENHSLHDPKHVLGLGSPFFIDYVVNFRVQYTVIKSALRLICIFSALVSDRQLPRYFNNDNYTVVTGKKINGMYISFLEIDALLNPLFCF